MGGCASITPVWYSDDGVNWLQVPNVLWNSRHASSLFVYDDALWMVAGNKMYGSLFIPILFQNKRGISFFDLVAARKAIKANWTSMSNPPVPKTVVALTMLHKDLF